MIVNTELSPEAYRRLMDRVAEGHVGDDVAFFCNANQADHLHLRRMGDEKDRLEGRVGFMAHTADGNVTILYFSHHEARMIAAKLLDLADELDGTTPLQFFPALDEEG